MSNSNTSLGFYIPNSDYNFKADVVLSREDYLFIITKENEILVYQNQAQSKNQIDESISLNRSLSYQISSNKNSILPSSELNRKYILLSHPQTRTKIFDIFIVIVNLGVLKHNQRIIVTISEDLILNYWNIKDGLCINKINLSNYKRKGEQILKSYILNARFLLFLFPTKCLLFDCNTGVIIKEEKLTFTIKYFYKVKDSKFFLLSTTNDTYFLDLQNLPIKSDNCSSEINIDSEYNYEEIRIRLLKHTFHIDKIFNEDSQSLIFSKGEFVFHNFNQTIKVSFLDSVEELNELSSLNTEYKFKIIYINSIQIEEQEHLIVVYKDLLCEIFIYDKKLREIKRKTKFMIMVEDEFLNMQYTVIDCMLIGYVDKVVNIFDMRKRMRENEKYVDKTIEMNKIYGNSSKKLNFTNYFKNNFFEICKEFLQGINKCDVKFGKDYFKSQDEQENSHVSNLVNYHNKHTTNKSSLKNKEDQMSSDLKLNIHDGLNRAFTTNITDDSRDLSFFTNFKVSASLIFSYFSNQSIYYVFGTDTGKIAIIDIFLNLDKNPSKNNFLTPNPMILIDYHTSRIETLTIYENKYLIASSEDGVITFTDISSQKLKSTIDSSENVIENFDYEKVKSVIKEANSNYYFSKKKSLSNINTMLDFGKSERKNSNSSGKEEGNNTDSRSLNKINPPKIINLLPFHTIKNYNKLKRILSVTQIDTMTNFQLDENFKRKTNILLGFQLENNSVQIIEIDKNVSNSNSTPIVEEQPKFNSTCIKTIYTFNINSSKNDIKAIYHISYQKTIIFYMDDNTIRITNYATKSADRIISDVNKIYLILRVDEKLKLYFTDIDNILATDFKNLYEPSQNQGGNGPHSSSKNEIFRGDRDQNHTSNSSVNNLYSNSINVNQFSQSNQNLPSRHLSTNSNSTGHNLNLSTSHLAPSANSEISLNFIKEILKNEKHKKIFMEKYIQQVFSKRKSHLNITGNKFESSWIKKIELLIIDQIFEIINTTSMIDKLKKICILNLLYNPTLHYKIFDRYEYSSQGIEQEIISMGGQNLEYLNFNMEDYLLYIEKIQHENKNKNLVNSENINYYNFISLFHIWNLSIDQDINMLTHLKIYQPIFDFSFVLKGSDSSMSIILNTEAEVDENEFSMQSMSNHLNFFKNYLESDEVQKKNLKNDKYCSRTYLAKNSQGYLTNFKNYKFSTNLSHFLNLSFFGSLIAVLGFEEMSELCKAISSEKSLLRHLAAQKYTYFTNLTILDKFMYEHIDDITLSNKDIILVDYLNIKTNNIKSSPINSIKFSDSSKINQTKDNSFSFKDKISNILKYLENLYEYLFNYEKEEDIFNNFYKLHKDKNIDHFKLNLLSEFELSLINLIVTYNSISDEKVEENLMMKISQLLLLFVFKILNPVYTNFKSNYSKIVVELLSRSTENLDKIYKENYTNYAKFLIDLYTSIKIPIDLDGLFKKYEIGNCMIIKSEDNYNFLKIMLAKLLKNFSKNNISHILKIVVEEFKKKSNEYDYFSYLLEILWILFREKNSKHVNYLPPLINLIMTAMSMQNKEMRHVCLDNAKKVLSCLLPNYPMIAFHQNSQKLAVGANDGKIYIYDLTSGNIWKNLSAHTNEITALCFDNTGNIIISYSSTEKTVKLWKIGLTNFFSNFFSMKDGYYKSIKYNPIQEEVSADEKVNIVKFQQMKNKENQIVLIREDKSFEVLTL